MKCSCLLGSVASLALVSSIAIGGPQKKTAKPAAATAQSKGSSSLNKKTKGTRRARTAPAPSYQLHPDPERYAEIQRALADKGYFKGEPNGEWKDDSIDALKRFQADQRLPDDGKISALTLSGLGLGPLHDGSTAATVPLPTAPSEPSVSGSTVGPASSATPKQDSSTPIHHFE